MKITSENKIYIFENTRFFPPDEHRCVIKIKQCFPNSVIEKKGKWEGVEPMKGEYPRVSVTGRSESRKFGG